MRRGSKRGNSTPDQQQATKKRRTEQDRRITRSIAMAAQNIEKAERVEELERRRKEKADQDYELRKSLEADQEKDRKRKLQKQLVERVTVEREQRINAFKSQLGNLSPQTDKSDAVHLRFRTKDGKILQR